jgi:hypothetical protein
LFIFSFDFHEHTFDDFVALLRQIPLREKVIEYFFHPLPEEDRRSLQRIDTGNLRESDFGVVADAINSGHFNFTKELKNELSIMLLYSDSFYVDELIKALDGIHTSVKALREKHVDKIMQCIEETKSAESLVLFAKVYNLCEDEAGKQLCAVSILNPFVSHEYKCYDKESVFLFGSEYKVGLNKFCQDEASSLKGFMFAVGGPVRFDIISFFKRHKRLALDDIAKLMNISRVVAWESVNILREEKILVTNYHPDRINIYYTLNTKQVRDMWNNLFQQFIDD